MYFISDIKNMLRSRITRILLLFLLAVMVLDPISVIWYGRRYTDFFQMIGTHPFQFWLLIQSASWGYRVYYTLFWIFPVLATGLIFLHEQKSSMAEFLMVRKDKYKYLLSKVFSTSVFVFVSFMLLLLANLAVTYMVFPADAPITQQYQWYIPSEGTLGYVFYQLSPIIMAVAYSFFNALAITIFSVFVLAVQMICKFRNKYIAIVVPVILLYTITYFFDSMEALHPYDMRMIIQPRSSNAISGLVTGWHFLITFGIWILVDFALVVIGIIRNKDIL